MGYTKLFDPDSRDASGLDEHGHRLGDQADRAAYVYDDTIVLAVNVALATGRPLLVSGEPGTGKSSLASDVASKLGWRFYPKTISSSTQARDLLWTFDTVRRLSDAQAEDGVAHPAAYVEPGVLWWAFEHDLATRRGLSKEKFAELSADPRNRLGPASYETANKDATRAVVLLDEIDKADPDVPNDLLEPLGSFRFRVVEGALNAPVKAERAPLVFITTNGERDLPQAFLRRCVHLEIEPATQVNKRLLSIAAAHFRNDEADADGAVPLHKAVSDRYFELRKAAKGRKPSTAEYLDAVSACRDLGLNPSQPDWETELARIAAATLIKRG